MLEPYRLDLKFSADIHSIAESANIIAQALAVIAGSLAKRDGRHFPTAGLKTAERQTGNNPATAESKEQPKPSTAESIGHERDVSDPFSATFEQWPI